MLLLPDHYPRIPFEDSTGALDSPQQLRREAEESGYLFFAGLLPESRIEPVRLYESELSNEYGWTEPNPENHPFQRVKPGAAFSGFGWDDQNFIELQGKVCTHAAFQSLVRDERILQILEMIYGEPAAVASMNQCWVKLPGDPERTTRPHQDTYYLPSCPRMWSVWFPLLETPLELGPLAVVPGSHKKVWPHADSLRGIDVPRDVTWATASVRPGDVVAYGAATVHCAWSNVSPDLVRVALDVRYEPAATPDSILRPR